jgi:hypothetical protein
VVQLEKEKITMLRINSKEVFEKFLIKNECMAVESTTNGTSTIYNATSFDKDTELTIGKTVSETRW